MQINKYVIFLVIAFIAFAYLLGTAIQYVNIPLGFGSVAGLLVCMIAACAMPWSK